MYDTITTINSKKLQSLNIICSLASVAVLTLNDILYRLSTNPDNTIMNSAELQDVTKTVNDMIQVLIQTGVLITKSTEQGS